VSHLNIIGWPFTALCHRKAESRSERLQTKLVAAESCRDSSVRELKQLMAVAEKLTVDQENLVRMVASKR
jgi:hypothetical protein